MRVLLLAGGLLAAAAGCATSTGTAGPDPSTGTAGGGVTTTTPTGDDAGTPACPPRSHSCACATGTYCLTIGAMCMAPDRPCPSSPPSP
jgi:hypothetical protein